MHIMEATLGRQPGKDYRRSTILLARTVTYMCDMLAGQRCHHTNHSHLASGRTSKVAKSVAKGTIMEHI